MWRAAVRGGLLAAAALVPLAVSAQSGLSLQSARESFATYEKEQTARQEALGQGNYEAADKHESAAREALLAARQAYEQNGVPAAGEKAVLLDYANVTRLLGYHDLAAEAMERVVKQEPGDAHAWALLGANAIECGPKHEPRGLEALRKSVAMDATSKDAAIAHLALGKFYSNQGLFVQAQDALAKAVAADAANVEAVLRLAALQVRGGKILEASQAIDALGKAAQPFDPMTRVLLRDALAIFEADGRYIDDTHDLHVAYSKLLYRAGRVPEAIMASSRALHFDGKDVTTLNFLGSMYMQLGNADGARQAYTKSLEVKPDQPMVIETLKQIPPPTTPAAPASATSNAAPAPPAALAAP